MEADSSVRGSSRGIDECIPNLGGFFRRFSAEDLERRFDNQNPGNLIVHEWILSDR